MSPDLLGQEFFVINVGLEVFARELAAQGATVVEIDWQPPVGGAIVAATFSVLLKTESYITSDLTGYPPKNVMVTF